MVVVETQGEDSDSDDDDDDDGAQQIGGFSVVGLFSKRKCEDQYCRFPECGNQDVAKTAEAEQKEIHNAGLPDLTGERKPLSGKAASVARTSQSEADVGDMHATNDSVLKRMGTGRLQTVCNLK